MARVLLIGDLLDAGRQLLRLEVDQADGEDLPRIGEPDRGQHPGRDPKPCTASQAVLKSSKVPPGFRRRMKRATITPTA